MILVDFDGFGLVALWPRGFGGFVPVVALLPWWRCDLGGLVAVTCVFLMFCVVSGFKIGAAPPRQRVGVQVLPHRIRIAL